MSVWIKSIIISLKLTTRLVWVAKGLSVWIKSIIISLKLTTRKESFDVLMSHILSSFSHGSAPARFFALFFADFPLTII